MSNTDLKGLIAVAAQGKSLTRAQAQEAFDIMMSGEASPSQIGGLLMALRVRGESIDEITGAVTVMRQKMLPIDGPEGAIDVCGTGGDGAHTLNISTAVAFVCAGCGVKVAKHGNRAASSKSGAADVLAALGVNIDADLAIVQKALWEVGTTFMWAQKHHSAMRHVGPTRTELGTRTIFNIMGPISNPAGVKRQLIGVFSDQWLEPIARVLGNLGTEHAWVVHGSDGLDEITVTGPTEVCELKNGEIRRFQVAPADLQLPVSSMAEIRGGDPEENANAIRELLDGKTGAYRNIVVMNAAGALVVAGAAADFAAGARMAAESIDHGRARDKLEQLVEITTVTEAIS
ncbi:MAG TPA: anthranilate phosphoribosyltransferase [Dongiaceae bacterium]|nr:anthranilate phosphoribosyltransferase [Dongiaceae bacterium]